MPLCGVSKVERACVRVCTRVEEKRVFVLADRSLAKEVAPQPKLAKQTCGRERFNLSNLLRSQNGKVAALLLTYSLLLCAERANGEQQ